MIAKTKLAGMVLLGMAFGNVGAAPITFAMNFTIASAVGTFGPPSGSPWDFAFHPAPAIGSVHTGTFTLDDAVLATDGLKSGIACAAFSLTLDGLTWDKNDPTSAYWGFRGPALGSISPLFAVVGGTISHLQGGVYGRSDAPFVDFWDDGTWSAMDIRGNRLSGNASITLATASVPEPASAITLLMGLAGLGGLTAWRRRKTALSPAPAAPPRV